MPAVSLFSEPLRVTVSVDWAGSRNGVLIGLALTEVEDKPIGLIVGEDGRVFVLTTADFTVDWRYHPELDRWMDINAQRAVGGDQE